MKKKRLLFLSHRLPFPVFNGQSTRTYNILRLLHRDFDIDALCFDNVDASRPQIPMQERRAALQHFVRSLEVVPVAQDHSRIQFVRDHLASVISRTAYTLAVYNSPRFKMLLRQILERENFDLVHLDTIDLIGHAEAVAPLPVVCNHNNVESTLLARRASSERNPLARMYIAHQAGLVQKLEAETLAGLALNVAVSEGDRLALEAIAPGARFVTVPNGVDTRLFDPTLFSARRTGCTFVGGTNWYPNKDALEWYASEIAPLIGGAGQRHPTRWVGHCTQKERAEYDGQNGITMVGFVGDVRTEFATSGCFVVPLRVGGGTRLKVLEAWAMGTPVVSTSVGCEGLSTRNGVNILIADTPSDFAAAVGQVLSDRALAARLGQAGRDTAVHEYSWDALATGLSKHYLSLVGS